MITILGATGNVGGKLAGMLAKKGKRVRLIARFLHEVKQHVGSNAEVYAGDIQDTEFLIRALKGSDAVFTMIPTNAQAENLLSHLNSTGESIARAIESAKINYVVNLSSIGADLAMGTGPIIALHNLEERLNRIRGLHVLHLRAAYFMENLLMNIEVIRSQGVNSSAIKGDIKIPMIATKDVAAYAAERAQKRDFSGSMFVNLLGPRDLSLIEATAIIGKKIKKPDLSYVTLSSDEAEKALLDAGYSVDAGRNFMEMSKALNEGGLVAGLKRNRDVTTETTFEMFCDEILKPAFFHKKAA